MYRNPFRKVMVTGVAVCMEIAMEVCQELLWIRPTPSRLVLEQDNGFIRIPACPVQPHETVALRCLSRLVENLQRGFVRMEYRSFAQFLMQSLIHRNQIVLRSSQNPVGHGPLAQLNEYPPQFLQYGQLLPHAQNRAAAAV